MIAKFTASGFLIGSVCVLAMASCDRKEKVLDVETPGGGIEVERDKDSGEVDIKIKDNE